MLTFFGVTRWQSLTPLQNLIRPCPFNSILKNHLMMIAGFHSSWGLIRMCLFNPIPTYTLLMFGSILSFSKFPQGLILPFSFNPISYFIEVPFQGLIWPCSFNPIFNPILFYPIFAKVLSRVWFSHACNPIFDPILRCFIFILSLFLGFDSVMLV